MKLISKLKSFWKIKANNFAENKLEHEKFPNDYCYTFDSKAS